MATMPRTHIKRLVWRITATAPMGEWVDPKVPVRKTSARDAAEGEPGNWSGSSFDLLKGVDVNDDPDTQPDTLWDDFFGLPPEKHKPSGR